MIEIKGMSHSLGKRLVLKDVDLTVKDSTVLGIVGINGAGKSTLLRLLSGVYHADEGVIRFDGETPANAKTRENIFFLPDDPYYAKHTPMSLFEFYRSFYPRMERELYLSYLSKYQIDEKGAMRNFSKGMRRQVFIALSLSAKSKYLLMDEAFDGLDPLSRKIFKDAIISHVEENGSTVLITSHSLRELEGFCDSFVLIDHNTVKAHGDIAEHVESLCKFQLAFAEPVDQIRFAGFPVVSLSINGKFVTVILRGESEAMKEKLMLLSPAVIEEFAVDFEEAFICHVEKKGGDA